MTVTYFPEKFELTEKARKIRNITEPVKLFMIQLGRRKDIGIIGIHPETEYGTRFCMVNKFDEMFTVIPKYNNFLEKLENL